MLDGCIQDTPRDRRLTFVAAQTGSKSVNPLCPSWQKLWLLLFAWQLWSVASSKTLRSTKITPYSIRRDLKKTPPGSVFIPSLRFAPRKTSSNPFSPRSHRFPCFSLIMTCWHIGLRRWRWWVMSPWVCCCPMGGGCRTPPHFNSEHKGNEDYEQVASYISSFFSRASRRGKGLILWLFVMIEDDELPKSGIYTDHVGWVGPLWSLT